MLEFLSDDGNIAKLLCLPSFPALGHIPSGRSTYPYKIRQRSPQALTQKFIPFDRSLVSFNLNENVTQGVACCGAGADRRTV
jgi:hypothetical protein